MHCIFKFRTALPYVDVNVLEPFRESAASTVVIEQGRRVSIHCNPTSIGRIRTTEWLQIVNGVEVPGKT